MRSISLLQMGVLTNRRTRRHSLPLLDSASPNPNRVSNERSYTDSFRSEPEANHGSGSSENPAAATRTPGRDLSNRLLDSRRGAVDRVHGIGIARRRSRAASLAGD